MFVIFRKLFSVAIEHAYISAIFIDTRAKIISTI